MHAEDPRHEVPPAIFGRRSDPGRFPIFFPARNPTVDASGVSVRLPNVASSNLQHAFRALACTGLRLSEAIHLRYADITADGLVIRRTKFRKAASFPFMTPRVQRSSVILNSGGRMRLWMITCSFRCGESHCWLRTRSVHFGPPLAKLACGANPVGHGRRSTRYVTPLQSEHSNPARMIGIASQAHDGVVDLYGPRPRRSYLLVSGSDSAIDGRYLERCERFVVGGHP